MTLANPRPGSLLFGTVTDVEAVRSLIVDPAAIALTATAHGLLASAVGVPLEPRATIGPAPMCVDPAIWVASWINRLARVHSVAPVGEESATQAGVLIVKPGFVADRETLAALQERLGEVGYRVAATRSISPAAIRDGQLIRRHYAAHWALAEHGGLSVPEQARLLDIYQTPEFKALTGRDAGQCTVAPAYAFAREHGISDETIAAWSRQAADAHGLNSGHLYGSNEVGDLAAVTLLYDTAFYDGPPVFLINPHILTVALWYEAAAEPVTVLHVEAMHDGALPWRRLREEVCGSSDPAGAWPGSLRRDVREGIVPIGTDPTVPISRLRNAVHLSNGPIEGLRELCIWFDLRPDEIAMTHELRSTGGWSDDQLLNATHCRVGRRERVLVEATNGCSVSGAAVLLQASTPVGRRGSNQHTFERLAIARAVADRLRGLPDVQAVLVSGSAARGRCSADSDVDLVALCDRNASRIDRHVEDGVVVEVTFHSTDQLLAELAGMSGSMLDLKRASRLSQAWPLHDPAGLHARIADAADAIRPDTAEHRELLATARDTLSDLRDDAGSADAAARMRSLCDIAAYLLIALSPLRFQKPKWVIDDLELLGEHGALDLLSHHYALQVDRPTNVIAICEQVIVAAAERLNLPSFAEARRAGLLPAAPEYSFLCQCLDDAKSLLVDGKIPGASYAAKFAGKMAICLLEESSLDAGSYDDIRRRHEYLFTATTPRNGDLDELDRILSRCASQIVC